jgi:hypothetical protein
MWPLPSAQLKRLLNRFGGVRLYLSESCLREVKLSRLHECERCTHECMRHWSAMNPSKDFGVGSVKSMTVSRLAQKEKDGRRPDRRVLTRKS